MALYNTANRQEFTDKVLESKKTVLVDFWAEWCPPCKAMAPALHDIAESLDEKLDVVKVNIETSEENARLASEHGVQSIPNMVVFRGGKEIDRIIGMVPKVHLEDMLTQLVEKN